MVSRLARITGLALVVAAALLATAAPPGVADSELVVSNHAPPVRGLTAGYGLFVAGPVLGGGRVVWAEQSRFGVWRVSSAPVEGADSTSETVRYAPARSSVAAQLAIAASATRIAVSDHVIECIYDCDYRMLVLDELATRSGGGPFEAIESCPGAGCEMDEVCFDRPRWIPALSGDVLAYSGDPCDSDSGIVYRDLSEDADHSPHTVPGRVHSMSASGNYLAWIDQISFDTGRLVVYDHVAAAEAYHVDGIPLSGVPDEVDVQSDGKAAFIDDDGVAWASPVEPYPHHVVDPDTPPGLSVYDLRIEGNRVAFGRPGPFGSPYSTVHVLSLDGSPVADARVDNGIGGLDFDGTRLTFATQPCQATGIVVWDLADPTPPEQPRNRCPAARVTSAKALLSSERRLSVRVRCPDRARLGCSGRVRLVGDARAGDRVGQGARGQYLLGEPRYAMGPGRTRTASVRLSLRAWQFLMRDPGTRVVAASISSPRLDLSPRRGFQVRTRQIAFRRAG